MYRVVLLFAQARHANAAMKVDPLAALQAFRFAYESDYETTKSDVWFVTTKCSTTTTSDTAVVTVTTTTTEAASAFISRRWGNVGAEQQFQFGQALRTFFHTGIEVGAFQSIPISTIRDKLRAALGTLLDTIAAPPAVGTTSRRIYNIAGNETA